MMSETGNVFNYSLTNVTLEGLLAQHHWNFSFIKVVVDYFRCTPILVDRECWLLIAEKFHLTCDCFNNSQELIEFDERTDKFCKKCIYSAETDFNEGKRLTFLILS